MKKKLLFVVSVLTALIMSILVSLSISSFFIGNKAQERKDRALVEAKAATSNLNRDIEFYIDSLKLVEFGIKENNGSYDWLIENIKVLFHKKSAIKSFIIRSKKSEDIYYPYYENDIFDFDSKEIKMLFEDSRKHGNVQMAMKADSDVRNCGEILLINPIYVEGKKGISEFWGYICCILQGDLIFSSSYLMDLDAAGYDLGIVFSNSINGATRFLTVFSETAPSSFIVPQTVEENFSLEMVDFEKNITSSIISSTINYEGFSFTLFLSPKGHWVGLADKIFIFCICFVACVLVICLAYMIYYLAKKENQLIEYSYIDGLTGLMNVRKYNEYLKSLMDDKKKFCIFYIDLDKFKPVNDNYGHLIGNDLLNALGKKINHCVKNKNDYVFRIGGDEFSVVVQDFSSTVDYELLASRIKQVIESETIIGDYKIKVGASIGYAEVTEDDFSYETVIRRAEEMMYREKKKTNSGR